MEPTVSIREFARMVGLSDMAARKAISNGSIKKGVTYDENGKPCIYPTIAAKEWGKEIKPDSRAPDSEPDESEMEDAEIFDFSQGIPDGTSKAEADRMIAVYKAKKARLEYLQTEGDLIDKGLVYSRLFDFASEVRNRLLNIPDRCIDAVLSADSRNQALNIMGKEIAEELTSLSKTNEFEIIEKR